MKLDDFTNAYIECALWSSNDQSNEQGGEPLDRNYCVADIAPATLEQMAQDCSSFQKTFGTLLDSAYGHRAYWRNYDYTPEARAGHDFWLTRNGHGAGFWDRGLGVIGDRLSEAAKSYGEYDLYVGDDGKIHG
jgi:hypothetical protein